MDTLRECANIRILCANDDTRVLNTVVVQTNEVVSIERKYSAFLFIGKRQYIIVRNFQVRLPGFCCRQNIMSKFAQIFDNTPGKILIA